jgi:hypothetical protein
MMVITASSAAAGAERTFSSGIAGSNPSDARLQAQTYFAMWQVKALLQRLEARPLSESDVRSALQGSNATIDDLTRTRILRRTPAGFVIGFSYFTADDMRRIHAAAERYVPSLVAAYCAHEADFDRIFRRYPLKSVDRKVLATVVIAGVALNWDALQSTKEAGYRRPELVTGPGWKYSFWAAEDDPGYDSEGFIWGSSSIFASGDNFEPDPVDFIFSSFGDPESDPRMNFPDLFYLPLDEMTPPIRALVQRIGVRNENYAGFNLTGVLGVSRARSVGPMLFALRRGPLSRSDLAQYADFPDRLKARDLIDLLVDAHAIRRRRDGRYELTTPVFDARDRAMLDAALALHRQILSQWLAETYPRLKAELATITPMRQGVPFDSAFTQIWHDFFGLATRQLSHTGVIADLRKPGSHYNGSIPLLWRRSIYRLDLG